MTSNPEICLAFRESALAPFYIIVHVAPLAHIIIPFSNNPNYATTPKQHHK
jgi:hypothetical protein